MDKASISVDSSFGPDTEQAVCRSLMELSYPDILDLLAIHDYRGLAEVIAQRTRLPNDTQRSLTVYLNQRLRTFQDMTIAVGTQDSCISGFVADLFGRHLNCLH